jgi:hypothetical protein
MIMAAEKKNENNPYDSGEYSLVIIGIAAILISCAIELPTAREKTPLAKALKSTGSNSYLFNL